MKTTKSDAFTIGLTNQYVIGVKIGLILESNISSKDKESRLRFVSEMRANLLINHN